MAWYDANRNRGRNTYGIIEPGYGGWQPAVVGYASAESYTTTTEQVVEYGTYPARPSPIGKELYKNVYHGVADNPFPWNRSSTHDRPRKGEKGSPQNLVHRDNSPPSRNHHYGKYQNNNFSSDDDKTDDENDVICKNGFCYPKNSKEGDYDKEKHKEYGYPPANYSVPHSTLHQPAKDPYHEQPYPHTYNGNHTVPLSTQPRNPYHETTQPDNQNPNHNGNSRFGPLSYTVPVTTQTKKNPYHETTQPDNHSPNHNGNGRFGPLSYTVPVTTQPKKDSYQETSINNPVVYNPPAPINTRPDTRKGRADYAGENTKNSPVSAGAQRSPFASSPPLAVGAQRSPFASSPPVAVGAHRSPFTSSPPKKDQGHRETIDSEEARRRYGGAALKAEPPQQNTGKIDSKEAARRYNGVFVSY